MEKNELSEIHENSIKDQKQYQTATNPIPSSNASTSVMNLYSKTIRRPTFDYDIAQIIEIVKILNNLAPISMPEYNFNADEINGERFFDSDGNLIYIRDFDSDVIRDYYYNPHAAQQEYSISKIMEYDKNTGKLKVKIEPITRTTSKLKTNITIFDEKVNNKYTIIQLSEGGLINSISEFSKNGKSFQTLFRNINTFKPARYTEGKEDKTYGFSMVDCIFDNNGDISRIKRYTSTHEINIEYTPTQKHITVRAK